MRRHGLASAAVASLLTMTLAACGGSQNAVEQTQEEVTAEETAAEVTTTNETAAGDATAEVTAANVQNVDPFVGRNISEFGFPLITESGEATNLAAIANGKPLVINLWATWCPYCVQELPEFLNMTQEYADRVSFAFIDLTDGNRETQDKVRAFLAENGLEGLPVYYDMEMGSIVPFEAYSIPTTIVFDANGNIVARIVGMINPDPVRALLQSLIV